MSQREKSWYMLLFQFRDIAEQWLTMNDWASFREWSQHPDSDAVISDLQRDKSLTPGLDWYRAKLVSLRAHRGSRALDAMGGARSGERTADRLPAAVTRGESRTVV
jgi:hypothetical protein